ncbi:hypothetical protein FRB99_000140 [Tulasnella sp. 403]|nr:hypothetical protein FRB99_000140 [Tulasnella sp. 403]
MFSRSQSYSKRPGLGGGGSGSSKGSNSKQRPSLETTPVSFSSNSGPSLAFSPVNAATRPPAGPAPDTIHLFKRSVTQSPSTTNVNASQSDLNASLSPTTTNPPTTPSSAAPNSANSALPMLPSIRSIRSRFPFGSKSGSHKKDRLTMPTAVDIIAGEDDVLDIADPNAHAGDRSLDPVVLRSTSPSATSQASSLHPPQPYDPLALPRMHSQPNLAIEKEKKRRSFDFASLGVRSPLIIPPDSRIPSQSSRGKSPEKSIGLGRPSFPSVRLTLTSAVGRTFTPGGTAINEAVAEGEGDSMNSGSRLNVSSSTARFPFRASESQVSIAEESEPERAPRRSASFDSAIPDSANVTRVVDLSMSPQLSLTLPPSTSLAETISNQLRASEAKPTGQLSTPLSDKDVRSLLKVLEETLEKREPGQSAGPALSPDNGKLALEDMRGAVLRMKALVNDVATPALSSSLSHFSPSPSGPVDSQGTSTPLLLSKDQPITSSGVEELRRGDSLGVDSFVNLNADTSFASSTIDVAAIEAALEKRLGKDFVGNILEEDDDGVGSVNSSVPLLNELPPTPGPRTNGTSQEAPQEDALRMLQGQSAAGSHISVNFEGVDPDLAALLSPNNISALSDPPMSTPTKQRAGDEVGYDETPLAQDRPNKLFSPSDDTPVINRRANRQRSESTATTTANTVPTTPSLSPTPLTPLSGSALMTPTNHTPSATLSGFSIRSRSHTPTISNGPTTTISNGPTTTLLSPTKRDSTSSQVSSSSSLQSGPSPLYSSSSLAASRTGLRDGVLTSRRAAPPLPLVIPDPLPPPKISPETQAFSSIRRLAGSTNGSSSSPASPVVRKRAMSIEQGPPTSPDKEAYRFGERRFALLPRNKGLRDEGDAELRATSPLPSRSRVSLDWIANSATGSSSRTSFDRTPLSRPSTSTAFHRKFKTNSPERTVRPNLGGSTSRRDQSDDLPPRSVTSFSFNRGAAGKQVNEHGVLPVIPSNLREAVSPAGPPISGFNHVRKRRSYSIDHAGDRTRFFASLGHRRTRGMEMDDDEPRRIPSDGSGTQVSSANPKSVASSGFNGEGSTRSSGLRASKTHSGSGWKELRNMEDLSRPVLSRASTLEHPSTPSSMSGPSRTLYAPSSTSSNAGYAAARTNTPSPVTSQSQLPTITISSHTETISLLKERHELEKDALLSALAEMKRENQRVTKERDELAEYVADLEERLAKAEQLNRKMEGLRMAVMQVAGDMEGNSEETVTRSSTKRSSGSVLTHSRRRDVRESSSSTASGSRPAKQPRRPRTADSQPEEVGTPVKRNRETPTPIDTSLLTAVAAARERKSINRRSASEASVLLPVMAASHSASMLLNERPPQNYLSSSAASDLSQPVSPIVRVRYSLDDEPPRTAVPRRTSLDAPSFSFWQADDKSDSSGGSLKLRLEDELHLADLVSMGPLSGDERDDQDSVF